MPSFEHEAIVLLIRERPELLIELLRRRFGVEVPANAVATTGQEVQRKLVPVEVRADGVIVLEGTSSKMALVVEVQRTVDPDKRKVWPAYVALLHRSLACPVLLVIVALDLPVANWCAQPMEVGPGFVLQPFVVDSSMVPQIVDRATAEENVEMAVLSMLAHGRTAAPERAVEIASAALEAIGTAARIDEDQKADYADIVLWALGTAARSLLEERMSRGNHQYQSDFARRYFSEGKVVGKVEGKAEGEAEALLEVLAARGIAVEGEQLERIRTCSDVDQLRRWLRRAATATTLTEVLDA